VAIERGAEKAFAADSKFTGYFFNPDNSDGYSNGVAFSSHLGYNINNWEEFRADILKCLYRLYGRLRIARQNS
jgi:hypothetical protein